MKLIYPCGKDTVMNAFNDSVENTPIPPSKDVHIIHYDEQHPKQGRTQKYRLTLLDGINGQAIAEELNSQKDPETIKEFFFPVL